MYCDVMSGREQESYSARRKEDFQFDAIHKILLGVIKSDHTQILLPVHYIKNLALIVDCRL